MGTLLTLGAMAKLGNVESSFRDGEGEWPASVGPYVIEARLGAGGMGAVYQAYDQRLDRRVAVKHLHPESAEDSMVRRRLQREAHAVAKLNHPAIVQIYDILETDAGDWIVMELVRGRTIRELVRSRELSLAQALFLAGEVASGLAEAHSKGVVHRDLKTENVMVTESGHAKILDFGLAKLLLEGAGDTVLSIHGGIVGTGRAMSPEQAKGEPVDHRSDLFSLGSLVYELVTGRAPFEGTSIIATLTQICGELPIPVRDLAPQVPRELGELIDRLLAKDPADRPDNTAEVAAQIMEIASRLTPAEAEAAAGAPGDSRPVALLPTPTPTHISRVTTPESSHSVFVKTLVSVSLAGAAELSGRLGDDRAAEVFVRHDRLVRDLLVRWTGVEVSKGGSFLLVLERPIDAIELALAYHRRLAFLADELGLEDGLAGRVGIHLGEIIYREDDPTWGSPPFEVDAVARRIAVRTEALAHPGQTLATQGAADIARRAVGGDGGRGEGAAMVWIPHGKFRFTKIGGTVRIFEVRAADVDALPTPVEDADVRRIGDPTREIPAPDFPHRWVRRPRRAAGAAVALAALAVFGWAGLRIAGRFFHTPGTADERTFALEGLETPSGRPDDEWIAAAVTEMVATHLGAAGGLRRAPAGAEADFQITGDCLEVDDGGHRRLRVRMEMRESQGRGPWTASEESAGPDLFALASSLGDRIRREVGLARLSSVERASLRALWPTDPQALRLYVEGLGRARASDPARARDLFQRAIANEPGHAAAHLALSEALLALGENVLAEEKARQAYELREGLPLPVVLLLEGAYYRASGRALLEKELYGEARRAFEEAQKRFEKAGDRERSDAVARELGLLVSTVANGAARRSTAPPAPTP